MFLIYIVMIGGLGPLKHLSEISMQLQVVAQQHKFGYNVGFKNFFCCQIR